MRNRRAKSSGKKYPIIPPPEDDSSSEEEKEENPAAAAAPAPEESGDRRPSRQAAAGTKHYRESSDDDDDDDITDKEDEDQPPPRKQPWRKELDDEDSISVYDQGENESTIAFCCARCTCTQAEKRSVCLPHENYCSMQEGGATHRKCCHKARNVDYNWETEYFAVANSGMFATAKEKKTYKFEDLNKKWQTAKQQETEAHNEDAQVVPNDQLQTSTDYKNKIERPFAEEGPRGEAIVLDCFAGIGGGLVALKRLGIAIKKVIVVEHDPVAMFVYKANHDKQFVQEIADKDDEISRKIGDIKRRKVINPRIMQHDDGVEEFVYIKKFEDLLKYDVKKFIREHGEIDIVIGGPPCTDFSRVNANRAGVQGFQGSYMERFALFIRNSLQAAQDKKIFFLVENTPISNDSEAPLRDGDLQHLCECFDQSWDPLVLDSKDYSPIRRKRTYFTNCPLPPEAANYRNFESKPNCCLEDDFSTAATLLDPEIMDKMQCLMASQGRIDDERMLVFKKIDDTQDFVGRTLTVFEREMLMGFPLDYVEPQVKNLFLRLCCDGYGNDASVTDPSGYDQMYWKERLAHSLHEFSGNFSGTPRSWGMPYKFSPPPPPIKDWDLPVTLKLANPPTGKTLSHFSAEGYAKHLIGNSFSIPVLEVILLPLCRLFDNRHYPGYNYVLRWEEEHSGGPDVPDGSDGPDDPEDADGADGPDVPPDLETAENPETDDRNENDSPGFKCKTEDYGTKNSDVPDGPDAPEGPDGSDGHHDLETAGNPEIDEKTQNDLSGFKCKTEHYETKKRIFDADV